MQSRVVVMEEGKDSAPAVSRGNQKVLPLRLLQMLLFFLGICMVFSFGSMYMVRYFGINVGGVASFMSPAFREACFQESNTLEHWIRPPPSLHHEMSDQELFWRATLVPRIKRYPFPRVPKIAFMFLTKGPLPLAPIWERFLKGHEDRYSIYIHSTPSYQPQYSPESVFYRRQIPSQVAEWGRMSMCDAERRLLANALLDISNEWFVLVSESCIPIFNFQFIYHYLRGSRYSYLGVFDDPGPFGRGRYNWDMAPEVNISQWRKGSQWFEVNRRVAVNIVEDTKYYPKFLEFCRPACYVDEHYFPTMLSIEAPSVLANRSITWVDWSRGGPHPATFGGADITEEFFKRIREDKRCTYNGHNASTCFLFARKFAPSALEPLLRLHPSALGY
uniref:Core-2/I-branching beta-1,6-N-acetylglucosaminyltransferase family protein n=1 Tax=Kalanchoe fedtschenkoi TaxID=63787 RepID=A0A7N0RF20_KALFE